MTDPTRLKSVEQCKGKIKDILSNEDIPQLAKDGVIPHYIITNPITKEETVWFMSGELNYWFENSFIKYKEGHFTQKYAFYTFDKHELRAINPPEELLRIKDLYQLPMQYVSTPPGVYFLCNQGKIVYIGQSINVSNRVSTHVNERLKDFDSAYFITCNVAQLNELESSLIRFYRPKYNGTFQKEATEKCLNIVEGLRLLQA